jgi:hypothetical protein
MRRQLLLFALLLLTISFGVNAQLIINGDFETGDLTGWENHAENGMVQSAGDIPPENAHQIIEGVYSYFKNWGGGDMISQVVTVEAGKEYTLSFEGFLAYDWIYVYGRVYDTSNDEMVAETNIHKVDLIEATVEFVAPESGSVKIIFAKGGDSPGRAGIDKIVLEEKTPPSLIENGDFETGDATGWDLLADNVVVQGAADMADPTQLIDGSYSCFKNWGAGDIVSQVVDVEPGQEYTLSFKGFLAWDWIYVYARVFDTADETKIAETNIHKKDSIDATFDFIAPASGSVLVKFSKSADSPGRAGIDNITLVAKDNGGVDEDEFARVQIIHNSADPLVDTVDIFVNGDLFLEDVAFRNATPFMDVLAGVDLAFVVAPAGEAIENGVGPVTVNFNVDGTYVVVAAGNVGDTGFDPVQPFGLYAFAAGQEQAAMAENTDVLVFHGSTDAPVVSIWETAIVNDEIIGDFAFGDFEGYLELATQDYILEVRDATGESTVAAYEAPLSTLDLAGKAIVVVASGYLTPENNNNGEPFGLYVALADGGELVELPLYQDDTNVSDILNVDLKLYPNPVNSILNIETNELIEELHVFDMLGQVVYTAEVNGLGHSINLNQVHTGIYLVKIKTQAGAITRKVQVSR